MAHTALAVVEPPLFLPAHLLPYRVPPVSAICPAIPPVSDIQCHHAFSHSQTHYLSDRKYHGQSVVPLLFQSGYLTISHHDAESGLYYMDFPNDEVKSGFFRYILPFYTSLKKEESAFSIGQFVEEIRTGKPQEFMARLQSFFADFQYDAQTTPESHFRNVLFILCKLLGMHVDAEYMTSDGRIDLLIRTNDYIYIIECKLDSTAEIALQQIEDKQYSLPWALDHREQIKIGVNFSSEKRRPDTWLICRGSVVVESDSTSSQTTRKTTQKTTQKIIELIENNNKISIDEMAQVCGLTRDGINYHIKKLKEKGLLERIGPDNGGSWVVKKN